METLVINDQNPYSFEDLTNQAQRNIDKVSHLWMQLFNASITKLGAATDAALLRQKAEQDLAMKLATLQGQRSALITLLAMEKPLVEALRVEESKEVRPVLSLQIGLIRAQRREVLKTCGVPEEVIAESQNLLPAPEKKKKKYKTLNGRS